jgi:cytochrome c biogenesis protein CcmG/thiol:disulfide interchange protein DsbE
MKRIVLWAPLVVFLLFVVVFASGLIKPDDRTIPSKLVGQPLPEFTLEPGTPGVKGLATADMRTGKPRLLNIFASWCVPCAAEAPQLMQLAQSGIEIDAVAIRDRPEDLARFLGRYGNPYARIGSDPTSSVQIAIGSAGVPETFVIDGKGIIRHQHIGDVRPEDVPGILRKLEEAR